MSAQPRPEPGAHELAEGYDVFSADPSLVRPLAHPMRLRIYNEAVRRPVSAKELSESFEQPLARLSYHVRSLADAGLLVPVRRTQRRGAVETHYRALATLNIDDKAMRSLPDDVQKTLFKVGVATIGEDVTHAIDAGAQEEGDILIARGHFKATAGGRERLHDELIAIYERLAGLEKELATEAAESGEEVFELNVVLMEYLGDRRAGRNGAQLVMWDRQDAPILETIPEGYD